MAGIGFQYRMPEEFTLSFSPSRRLRLLARIIASDYALCGLCISLFDYYFVLCFLGNNNNLFP